MDCDRFGRHPLPSRRIRMTADVRNTVLQRSPIGHHRAKWRTTAYTLPGSPTEKPEDSVGPRRHRPVWAATDLDDVSSSVRVQDYLSRRRAASIEQHDPRSRRLTFSRHPGKHYPTNRRQNRVRPTVTPPCLSKLRRDQHPSLRTAADWLSQRGSVARITRTAHIAAANSSCSSRDAVPALEPELTVAHAFSHMTTRLDFNSY